MASTGSRLGNDQAEGLRRLFSRRPGRVIAVASGWGGVGRTSAAINLAAALGARGRGVLVIDENDGPGNAAGSLGVTGRRDLLDVMRGACTLDEALISAPCEVAVLPAANAVRSGPRMERAAEASLDSIMSRLGERFELILVDALRATTGGLVPCVQAAQEAVVVCSGGYAAITASYAMIKELRASRGPLRYHLLLNRVADERAARVIFDNLERLSRDRLETQLEYLGCVTRDEHVLRAARMRQPVVAAFPSSPAARAYARCADELASSPANREHTGGLERFLQLFRGGPLTLANAGA